MDRYSIYHRVYTPAYINGPFEVRGFSFSQWNFTIADGPMGDSWVVHKTVEAGNGLEAINQFRKGLAAIVDRASTISQCQMNMLHEAFCVIRTTNNDAGSFFFRCSYMEKGVTGLSFDTQEVQALRNSLRFHATDAFEYLHEANNATSYLSRLMFLVLALEALAGDVKDNAGFIHTNKESIKNDILCDAKLYDSIYQYGEGIRNKIFHGASIRTDIQSNGVDYVESIYKKILLYLKRNNIQIEKDVVSPGRNFFGNYRASNLWLKPKELDHAFEFRKLFQEYKDIFEKNWNGGRHPDYDEIHPALKIQKY